VSLFDEVRTQVTNLFSLTAVNTQQLQMYECDAGMTGSRGSRYEVLSPSFADASLRILL